MDGGAGGRGQPVGGRWHVGLSDGIAGRLVRGSVMTEWMGTMGMVRCEGGDVVVVMARVQQAPRAAEGNRAAGHAAVPVRRDDQHDCIEESNALTAGHIKPWPL